MEGCLGTRSTSFIVRREKLVTIGSWWGTLSLSAGMIAGSKEICG